MRIKSFAFYYKVLLHCCQDIVLRRNNWSLTMVEASSYRSFSYLYPVGKNNTEKVTHPFQTKFTAEHLQNIKNKVIVERLQNIMKWNHHLSAGPHDHLPGSMFSLVISRWALGRCHIISSDYWRWIELVNWMDVLSWVIRWFIQSTWDLEDKVTYVLHFAIHNI